MAEASTVSTWNPWLGHVFSPQGSITLDSSRGRFLRRCSKNSSAEGGNCFSALTLHSAASDNVSENSIPYTTPLASPLQVFLSIGQHNNMQKMKMSHIVDLLHPMTCFFHFHCLQASVLEVLHTKIDLKFYITTFLTIGRLDISYWYSTKCPILERKNKCSGK